MPRKFLLALGGAAALALTLVPAGLTLAASPAEVIAQREAFMDLQGATAIGMVAALKAGDYSTIAKLSKALESSAKVIPSLFEKGTGPEAGKTKALPAIWEKWDDFKAAAQKLETEASKLTQVAKSGDKAAIGAQFKALGDTCDGCHDNFRAK